MPKRDRLEPGQKKLHKAIEHLLRQGVLPLDEIADHVEFELDDEDLITIVRATWQRLSPHPITRPTALDRLQLAFDHLEAQGILARHYVDAGRSEAEQLIRGEIAAATARGRTVIGYCYWDRHLYQMMGDGQLGFCFGPAAVPHTYRALWSGQMQIAGHLAEALGAQGFEVEWSGQPADAVRVVDVDWTGARRADGEPELRAGPQEELVEGPQTSVGPSVKNVFVSGPKAHALIASIARAKGRPMYGDVEARAHTPAAVDVELEDGRVLDFVASEDRMDVVGILRARDLSRDCERLVVLAPGVGEIDSDRWSSFAPAQRVLVIESGAVGGEFEGSKVVAVELGTGRGVDELLGALSGAGGLE